MNMKLKKQNLRYIFFSMIFIFPIHVTAQAGKDLIDGRLAPCPNKPNCLNTEHGGLVPVSISIENKEQAWVVLQKVIKEQGGSIKKSRSDYLWATFETDIIKFTDDVEVRMDADKKLIHFRSASRAGYYDFNANKNRLKKIINSVNRKLKHK